MSYPYIEDKATPHKRGEGARAAQKQKWCEELLFELSGEAGR